MLSPTDNGSVFRFLFILVLLNSGISVAQAQPQQTQPVQTQPVQTQPLQDQSSQVQPLVANSGIAALPLADCKTDLRYLNQVFGWQATWPTEWERLVGASHDSVDAAITKWQQASAALTNVTNLLKASIAAKETAPPSTVNRVLQQVRDLHESLLKQDSAYLFPQNSSVPDAEQWNTLLGEEIAPAIDQFAQFLATDYFEAASKSDGLFGVVNGEACFSHAIEFWTTLSPDLNQIEITGFQFLKEAREELLATGREGENVEQILDRLRKQEFNTTKDDLIDISNSAIVRAQAQMSTLFLEKSLLPVKVVIMPEYMQASFPAGMYRFYEGDEFSEYIINPSRPAERRLMAEVIAFHEAVPGHHTFGQYPRDPDTGQKGNSGIFEGWAIYAEYLADEVGLYSEILDRQGMIAKHLWASSRLIVEPGLHLHGWSREKAIQFMLENTLLSRAEIEIEVDRYISMPGQSLSYMLGADIILSERARARSLLGSNFNIAEFHDIVLRPGARPLPKLKADIRAWVASKQV